VNQTAERKKNQKYICATWHRCPNDLRGLKYSNINFTYKLVFGSIDLNLSIFFSLCSDDRYRGQYKLFLPGCNSSTRCSFFTYRAAKMWNDLPADSTDFSSLNSFKRCLTSKFLARYSKVYFYRRF